MRSGWWSSLAVFILAASSCLPLASRAATFPGTAHLEVTDPSGGLSWSNPGNALTVSCLFRLSVPSASPVVI